MSDRRVVEEIRERPALFGLDGSFSQSVAFLLGLDLGRSGGLLRGFTEWLIVRRGRETSLRWTALVLEEFAPGVDRAAARLDTEQSRRAAQSLFTLLVEFLELRENPLALAAMYGKYMEISTSKGS